MLSGSIIDTGGGENFFKTDTNPFSVRKIHTFLSLSATSTSTPSGQGWSKILTTWANTGSAATASFLERAKTTGRMWIMC